MAIVLAIALVSCDQGIPQVTGIHNVTKGIEYQNIQEAIAESKDGETIQVGPGSYKQELALSKPITLKGFGNPIIGAVTIASSNVTLEGFTIESEGVGISISHTEGPFDGIRIVNNKIDSKQYGIARFNHNVKSESVDVLTNLSIIGNHFSGGSSEEDKNQGILLFTDLKGTTRIEGNTFKDKLAGLNGGENSNEKNPKHPSTPKEPCMFKTTQSWIRMMMKIPPNLQCGYRARLKHTVTGIKSSMTPLK